MDNLSLLVKPASGLCNMACRYCFYRDETEHYKELDMRIMPEETMELLIERACAEAKSSLRITFQGGEPTLADLSYFRRFTELVREKKRRGTAVSYAIQTNGLLLDEEWTGFLAENHFLVGLSFDGTPRIHDANRTDRGGAGTASRVERAWELLRKHKVETNLLCVVTEQAAKKPQQVYRYMKEMGAAYLQFIPCIPPAEARLAQYGVPGNQPFGSCIPPTEARLTKRGVQENQPFGSCISPTEVRLAQRGVQEDPFSIPYIPHVNIQSGQAADWKLTSDAYAYFLKAVFDLWYRDWQNGVYISVRHLDDYLKLLLGRYASSCAAMGQCGGYFAVENDGSVYPCDFFVSGKWYLGNIREMSFAELAKSRKMTEFLTETYKPAKCRKCVFYRLCRGGCKNDYHMGDKERENRFCGAYQEFFSYAMERMRKMSALLVLQSGPW